MATSGKIILKSMEGHLFEIERNAALLSPVLSHLIEDLEPSADDSSTSSSSSSSSVIVPVFKATSRSLAKIVEYLRKHAGEGGGDEAKTRMNEKWERKFINGFEETEELLDVMKAASYLNLSGLLLLVVKRVASMVKDMTVEEARGFFKIEGDYMEEEEAKIRTDFPWDFQT